jgi:hypothetical protein
VTLNVHPADRFTWERIVLRARLNGVIGGSGRISERTGRPTRGGVSATVFKAVALAFATHANEDGSDVRPGDMRVAVLTEAHHQTVKAVREKLIELGLMTQTGRHRHTPQYRLTLPEDLTDLLDVLSPDDVVEAAKARRKATRDAKAQSRKGYAGGVPKSEATGTPPAYPNGPDADENGYAGGTPKSENGYAVGNDMGTPPEVLNQVRTGQQDHHPADDEDLRTAVAGPRATDPEPRPSKCSHGLSGGLRADGLPKCALCRVSLRSGQPPPEPPPIAPVIDLDSRRTA